MCVRVDRVLNFFLVWERVDRVWDSVNLCTCGKKLGSCECVYV